MKKIITESRYSFFCFFCKGNIHLFDFFGVIAVDTPRSFEPFFEA